MQVGAEARSPTGLVVCFWRHRWASCLSANLRKTCFCGCI